MKKFVFAIACLLLIPTLANAFGEIRYSDRPLNLRKQRDAKSEWVGMLQKGQKVRVAWLTDGWVAVLEPWMDNPDKVRIAGYANVRYLRTEPQTKELEAWGEIMHAGTTVNVRADSERDAPKVGSLQKGDTVRVDFPEDEWIAVFDMRSTIRSRMNAVGFVSTKYLEKGKGEQSFADGESAAAQPVAVQPAVEVVSVAKPEVPAKPKAQPVAPAAASWGKIVTVAKDVFVRKERAEKSKYVRTLKAGQQVRVDFPAKGWVAVFLPSEKVRAEKHALGYARADELDADMAAAMKPSADSQPVIIKPSKGQTTLLIKRDPTVQSLRPAPKADQEAHGFKYGIIEQADTSLSGIPTSVVRVYVDITKLPKANVMEDFCNTLWKKYRKSGKELRLEVLLPGMDQDDIAFIIARYTYNEKLEFWPRKAALFGTKFMEQYKP